MAYYVYILSSRSKTLYVGVTNDLERRVYEHKAGLVDGFSKRYNIDKLVYCEDYESIRDAIAREAGQSVASTEESRPHRVAQSGVG